jgi:polyhydroxybutyrate depolymerase
MPGTTGAVDLDGRQYRLYVPTTYDGLTKLPLVVALHGYSADSSKLDSYLGLTAAAESRGFLLALPEGTKDGQGNQFWNAVSGGCCDFGGSKVDDSGYLSQLITQVSSSYTVSEVAVLGHSNGGYMAQRLACDHADQVDAIVSVAGPLASDTSLCKPSRPVKVLHIHGDADETVAYGGGTPVGTASAEDTVKRWAQLDGCGATPTQQPALDLESTIAGDETTVSAYTGCQAGSTVQLWTIHGGHHVPTLSSSFTPDILDFLLGPAAPAPGATPTGPPPAAAAVQPGLTGSIELDGRPYQLHVPTGYSASKPVPLVVGLHGYTSQSSDLDNYFELTKEAEARGFLLALPEGTKDSDGNRFWNAITGGCCDIYRSGVDDSGYLSRLVTQVKSAYAVSEVAVVGHSNGGYMAERFACDHADQVDAIASLAGPLTFDTSKCQPAKPVKVLHIHGDADETVNYGGSAADWYAGAQATVGRWAVIDGCAATPTPGAPMDLEGTIPGAETATLEYTGCQAGTDVRLWTIHGGRHVPVLTAAFAPAMLDFVLGQS